jgi:hypothetical protein
VQYSTAQYSMYSTVQYVLEEEIVLSCSLVADINGSSPYRVAERDERRKGKEKREGKRWEGRREKKGWGREKMRGVEK